MCLSVKEEREIDSLLKYIQGFLSLISFLDISSLENIGWSFLWEVGRRKKHWTLVSLSSFPFKMSQLSQYFNSDYQHTFTGTYYFVLSIPVLWQMY